MKSRRIKYTVFCLIVIVVIILITLFLFKKSNYDNLNVGTFSLIEYEWEISNYQSNINVGKLSNKVLAIEKTKSLWNKKYNIDTDKLQIKISFDSEENCWHIYNITPSNTLGGVYHAIIRMNGDVIAIWVDD